MSSYFYSRITFPNPHIFLKGKTLCVSLKFVILDFSGSIHDNISSLSNTKNMQSLISWNFEWV